MQNSIRIASFKGKVSVIEKKKLKKDLVRS